MCPVCEAPLEENATYCPSCESELTNIETVKKPNYYSIFLRPITSFTYNFLGIFVITIFIFTFFLDLSEPSYVACLTPMLITMSKIKWMFISMQLAGIDMYLHMKKTKKHLFFSFIPSIVMLIGLIIALYRFEYPVGEMIVIGFLFVILLIMLYFDFITFLNYPKETDEKSYMGIVHEAELKLASGFYELALQLFNKAISLSPTGVEAWIGKGSTLLKMRKIPDALACFDKVVEMKPDNEKAWNGKGLCYISEGKYPTAVHFFNKAIDLEEDYINAWLNLGYSYLKLEQYNDAKTSFDRVIQIDPNNVDAWNFRGKAIYYSGRDETDIGSIAPEFSLDEEPEINPLSPISRSTPAVTSKVESKGVTSLKKLLPPIDDEQLDSSDEITEPNTDEHENFIDEPESIDEKNEQPLSEYNTSDNLFEQDIEDDETDDVFFCPECNHIISKNANQCPKCGVVFSNEDYDSSMDELIESESEIAKPVNDYTALTENDLADMEGNLHRLANTETKNKKAISECLVCGAMLFEGYKECPVCGEAVGGVYEYADK